MKPAFTASTAWTTACRPEPQTRFTVSAGTSTGTPAFSAAWRATFMPAPACSTQPMMTSPRSTALMAARRIASRMTTAPRSAAERSLNTPPKDPIGVRQADKMTALSIQFGSIRVLVERLGIGQRLAVVDRAPMHDVAHGQLYYLPTLRPRNLVDLQDSGRHVPGCRVGADLRTDAIRQRLVEDDPVAQPDEEHDPLVSLPLLPDDEALDDLCQLFYLAVDF